MDPRRPPRQANALAAEPELLHRGRTVRMRRTFGILLAATVATPAALSATPVDALFWRALCSSGSVVACGSILVRTVATGPHSNIVEVWIRNLQGFDPRDNTGGSIFSAFSVTFPNSPSRPDGGGNVPRGGTVGSVGIVDGKTCCGGGWGIGDGYGLPYSMLFMMLDAIDGFPGDGVRGCDPGPNRPLYLGTTISTIETCAAKGYTGWATISTVTTPGDGMDGYEWDISGSFLSVYGVTQGGANFHLDFPAGAATVTPEPSSIALLASGVALVGVAGWRRRKRAAG